MNHIYDKCLTLTSSEKEEKFTETNIPWDLDDDLATYFVKLDQLEEELKRGYNIKWPTTMKINCTVNEMPNIEQFESRYMMDWEDKYVQDKMWVHLPKLLQNIVDA